LLTQCKRIYFLDLVQLKDLMLLMWLKPKKWIIMIITPLINSSLQQLKYLDVYKNKPMCFNVIMPMPFGAWNGQRAFLFLFWLLFFVKKFQSHCKNCKYLPP
jgi:hypothetical protein